MTDKFYWLVYATLQIFNTATKRTVFLLR